MFSTIFLLAVPAWANQPPVADAGPDKETLVDESVILEGSATDPDGDPIVDYYWEIEEQPAGATGVVSPPFMPNPSFTGNVPGDYVVAFTVFDGGYWSLPDTVTVTVKPNLPPTAVALADITSGPAPLTVNFDGSQSSDPEGRPMSFRWNFGDGDIESEMSPTHVFLGPGDYVVELRVADDIGQTDPDRITITVCAIAPPGDFEPDCDVDFDDFAVFALAWLTEPGEPEWNPACDISIPADNSIDWHDLDVLTDNWLAGL